MKRVTVSIMLLLALVSATGCAVAAPPEVIPAPQGQFTLYPVEQWLVAQVNLERAKVGVPPAAVSERLVLDCREHCIEMCRTQVLKHTEKHVAENIAMNQTDAAEAMKQFMASPGHKKNILDPKHNQLGAAAYQSHRGTIFYAMQFDNKPAAILLPPSAPKPPRSPLTMIGGACPGGNCRYR